MHSGQPASTPPRDVPAPSSTKSSPATLPNDPKRYTMAKGVQTSFSAASKLSNFLPTGTTLIFNTILPTIYRGGQCSPLSTIMMHVLLGLCVAICFFSQFTDSFPGPDKKPIYGFVLPSGLKVFNPDPAVQVPTNSKYKMEFADYVHALLSVVVFLAIAFSDQRVIDCLLPQKTEEVHQVMDTLVLIVAFVCSSLFLLFPVTRHGFVPA